MDNFSAIVTQMDPETVKMDLSGKPDRRMTGELLDLAFKMDRKPAGRILLDLSGLDPLTGDGLQTLCALHAVLARRFGAVYVRGLSDETRQILALSHLDRLTREYADEDQTGARSQPGVAENNRKTVLNHWSQPVERASLNQSPEQMINLNVDKRPLTSPADSFGRMWLRTYRVRLCGDRSPEKVMARWRKRFSDFWPPDNRIHSSSSEFEPGSVCLINLAFPLGMVLSTGAVVIHADDASFTLMTVQGHMFSGLITFSSYREGEHVYAQTQALVRPSDPLYEFTFRLGYGPKTEDAFWVRAMKNVATHFNTGSELRCPIDDLRKVETSSRLIDPSIRWHHSGNLWYNAAVRSAIHQFFRPIRRLISR